MTNIHPTDFIASDGTLAAKGTELIEHFLRGTGYVIESYDPDTHICVTTYKPENMRYLRVITFAGDLFEGYLDAAEQRAIADRSYAEIEDLVSEKVGASRLTFTITKQGAVEAHELS